MLKPEREALERAKKAAAAGSSLLPAFGDEVAGSSTAGSIDALVVEKKRKAPVAPRGKAKKAKTS